jgi:hypothetical protein
MDRWMIDSPAAVAPAEQVEAAPADEKVARHPRRDALRLL